MKKTFVYSALSQAVLFAMAMPAVAETSEESITLDAVSVVGSGSMYRMGEVPFHQARSAVALSREELDRQDVRKADEIARYQAGFTNQMFGNDTNTNWFRVRGAEVSQAVDGLPTFSYGFFTPYVETFGLEAIEVTKGADAMTFGAAQSGGLINYVSKRAHKDQVGKGEFKVNMGNRNQYGVAADYTGAMNADESLRYRTVLSYNGKDGEWDGTKNKTLYFAPSIQWDISERTRLDLLMSYQRDHGVPSSNFLPQDGTLVSTPRGYISRSTNLGDPDNDTETNRQYSIGYALEHDFANGVRFSSSYRYSYVDNFHRGSYAFPVLAADYSLSRGVVYNDGKAISHSTDNHISWNSKGDWFNNTLVVGTDYRHQKVDTMYEPIGFGATAGTNAFDSSVGYNQVQNPSSTHRMIKARQLGFYLQNQTRFFDQLVLGLGIRHDRAKQDEYTSVQSVKKNHTSYAASVMYETAMGLNPYFGYSEAFSLPVGISGSQSLYKPNITRQYEVGVKYLPTWLDGTISVAAFQAKDEGAVIATANATGVGVTESSEDPIRRKGVEVQFDTQFTQNWLGTLAYTYLQSYSDKVSGRRYTERLPKHTASAKTAYTFNGGMLDGLTLGAGVRYIGKSMITNQYAVYNGRRVPSATVVDLMARYQFNPQLALQVNADNVGDRRYISGCDTYCYYGAGRNINASLSYKF